MLLTIINLLASLFCLRTRAYKQRWLLKRSSKVLWAKKKVELVSFILLTMNFNLSSIETCLIYPALLSLKVRITNIQDQVRAITFQNLILMNWQKDSLNLKAKIKLMKELQNLSSTTVILTHFLLEGRAGEKDSQKFYLMSQGHKWL